MNLNPKLFDKDLKQVEVKLKLNIQVPSLYTGRITGEYE